MHQYKTTLHYSSQAGAVQGILFFARTRASSSVYVVQLAHT